MTPLDAAYAVAAVLGAPVWARKSRAGWRERFGDGPRLPEAGRPRLLVHAVSVGEVGAVRALVPMLAPHAEVVVSAGTDTGVGRARELFEIDDGAPAHVRVVRYPLDFSWCVGRFLRRVRPDAVALVELEVWPNFIAACRRGVGTGRAIPVAVINGRISERSFRTYRRARPVLRRTFASLALVAAQDEAYAERFRHMGVASERVRVTGSLKWDATQIADDVPGAVELAADLGIDRARPLVVAGSTGPLPEDTGRYAGLARLGGPADERFCEERLIAEACPPGVQVLCAPRKPERFDAAFRALGGEARCVRRTTRGRFSGKRDRFLLDTIGELRAAYALADVVVVGRTFGNLVGSDPIEPAALGKPVLIGPAHAEFKTVVETLAGAGGVEVVAADDLADALGRLLGDAGARRARGALARECVHANQGATRRQADLLLGLLTRVPARPAIGPG